MWCVEGVNVGVEIADAKIVWLGEVALTPYTVNVFSETHLLHGPLKQCVFGFMADYIKLAEVLCAAQVA